ncbi:hypothetical protein SKUN_001744 (plasmid) [Spiroplasma kunkelii CR2-3x]|uniref:Uncharacterized protein n=1 Tax=Spiroplasma kunkelii CR2-3x TaxID=273035 RepID=A0A0K2JJ29_SPIKU|nr:hypothetical protein [Spiroplasma kunkelii]ALA98595.1 hypothetical protein SKUN_001744 [Spiroplasma kunkelii CR2-3x]
MLKLKNVLLKNNSSFDSFSQVKKLVSYFNKKEYKQRPHQLKIPTMKCKKMVEAFKKESQNKRQNKTIKSTSKY